MGSIDKLSTPTGDRFDSKKFNQEFEKEIDIKKTRSKYIESEKLAKMSKEETTKSITNITIAELLINIKDAWFDMIDDLLQNQFNLEIFTKNNRLFYIGLTLVVIIILIYIYDTITDDQDVENKKIVEVRHIYKVDDDKAFKLVQDTGVNLDKKYIDTVVKNVAVLSEND